VLFHYKAFTAFDVAQTALALQGWGVGLVGIVAIKVLAPGYYARQDIKTPVRIAIAVLVITQLLNWALVPFFKHAALSLSIGLGAVINALWLLVGLRMQKSYQPEPGWLRFLLQVILGAVVLAVFLGWAAQAFQWLDMPGKPLQRIGGVAAVILGAGALYLGTVSLLGLNLRQFLRR
jgi:putative peptidoglycan lipid II flippase